MDDSADPRAILNDLRRRLSALDDAKAQEIKRIEEVYETRRKALHVTIALYEETLVLPPTPTGEAGRNVPVSTGFPISATLSEKIVYAMRRLEAAAPPGALRHFLVRNDPTITRPESIIETMSRMAREGGELRRFHFGSMSYYGLAEWVSEDGALSPLRYPRSVKAQLALATQVPFKDDDEEPRRSGDNGFHRAAEQPALEAADAEDAETVGEPPHSDGARQRLPRGFVPQVLTSFSNRVGRFFHITEVEDAMREAIREAFPEDAHLEPSRNSINHHLLLMMRKGALVRAVYDNHTHFHFYGLPSYVRRGAFGPVYADPSVAPPAHLLDGVKNTTPDFPDPPDD
jgi:hypothetical protein